MNLNALHIAKKTVMVEDHATDVVRAMLKAIVNDAHNNGIDQENFKKVFPEASKVFAMVGSSPEAVYKFLKLGGQTEGLVERLTNIRCYSKSLADFLRDCSSRGIGPRRVKAGFPDAKHALETNNIDPFDAYKALGLYDDTQNESPMQRKVLNYLYNAKPAKENGVMFDRPLYEYIKSALNNYLDGDRMAQVWPNTTKVIQRDGFTWNDLIAAVKASK